MNRLFDGDRNVNLSGADNVNFPTGIERLSGSKRPRVFCSRVPWMYVLVVVMRRSERTMTEPSLSVRWQEVGRVITTAMSAAIAANRTIQENRFMVIVSAPLLYRRDANMAGNGVQAKQGTFGAEFVLWFMFSIDFSQANAC